MRKFTLPPILFLLFGAICTFLRNIIVHNGFDENGLPIRGFWAITAVNIILILMVIAAIVLALRMAKSYEVPADYRGAFGTGSLLVVLLKMLCAVAFICGAAFAAIDVMDSLDTKIKVIQFAAFSVASVVGFVALLRQALAAYTGKHTPADAYLGAFIAFSLALRVIMIYFSNTTNPTILSFSFDCIALSASCLFIFLSSGWFLGKKQVSFTVVCGLVSTMFFLTSTVSSTASLGDKVICVATGIYSLIGTLSFFKNMKKVK